MDAEKRRRVERLNTAVIEGQEAETVKKYADEWLKEVKGEVLNRLLEEGSDPIRPQYRYQACNDFHQYIMHKVQVGQMKEEKLNSIIKGER